MYMLASGMSAAFVSEHDYMHLVFIRCIVHACIAVWLVVTAVVAVDDDTDNESCVTYGEISRMERIEAEMATELFNIRIDRTAPKIYRNRHFQLHAPWTRSTFVSR